MKKLQVMLMIAMSVTAFSIDRDTEGVNNEMKYQYESNYKDYQLAEMNSERVARMREVTPTNDPAMIEKKLFVDGMAGSSNSNRR